MALAERATLVAELRLDDKMSGGLSKVGRTVGKLETRVNQMGKGFRTLGAGIGTAITRGAFLAIGAIGALTTALGVMVKEGQDAASVELIYANAIAKSGKVSASYVGILNAQQKALMNLAGVDDELIKTEQTRLIQMGLTGEAIAKLTPLILDASKATGRDLLAVTLAVGKAVNGNVAGLQRYGIFVDKTKAKIDPLGAVVDALNKKFGGTTKALSGTLEARLGALREGLKNIREEAGIKLLPALTHIADVIGRAVIPAFGKFVDRIMPGIVAGIDGIAKALEGGGAERAIGGITDALGTMIDMLRLAAEPVKLIVGAFLKLPKELQTVLIAGFAVNKLSGGLIGQGLGEIAGGFFKRGGSPANPLFVADVTGGGIGGVAGKGGGLLATLTSLPVLIGAAVIAGVSTITWQNVVMPGLQNQADVNSRSTEQLLRSGSMADLKAALAGLENMPRKLDPLQKALYDFNASGIKTHTETLEKAIRDEIASRSAPINATAVANAGNAMALAGGLAGPAASRSGVLAKPGAAGVFERSIAAGKDPTAQNILRTLQKNAERTKAAAEETRKMAAAQAMAERVRSLQQSFANMQLLAIASKVFNPTITVPVTVNSTVSIRGLAASQRISASYNNPSARFGPQKT